MHNVRHSPKDSTCLKCNERDFSENIIMNDDFFRKKYFVEVDNLGQHNESDE